MKEQPGHNGPVPSAPLLQHYPNPHVDSHSCSLHFLLLSVSSFWLIVGKKILFVLKTCCGKIYKCFVL